MSAVLKNEIEAIKNAGKILPKLIILQIGDNPVSNIYIKQGNDWLTPPLACGLLGGVMRQHLLKTGQVREAILTLTDFEQPDVDLRLSNALRGWFDVQRADSLFPGRDLP